MISIHLPYPPTYTISLYLRPHRPRPAAPEMMRAASDVQTSFMATQIGDSQKITSRHWCVFFLLKEVGGGIYFLGGPNLVLFGENCNFQIESNWQFDKQNLVQKWFFLQPIKVCYSIFSGDWKIVISGRRFASVKPKDFIVLSVSPETRKGKTRSFLCNMVQDIWFLMSFWHQMVQFYVLKTRMKASLAK